MEEVLPKFETFDDFVARKEGDADADMCARCPALPHLQRLCVLVSPCSRNTK